VGRAGNQNEKLKRVAKRDGDQGFTE